MERNIVRTAEAPPRSAVFAGVVVPSAARRQEDDLCSGQIPLDPATGDLIEATSTRRPGAYSITCPPCSPPQGRASRTSSRPPSSSRTWTTSRGQRRVRRALPNDPPARATVQAAKLPRGAAVEIDAIAVV